MRRSDRSTVRRIWTLVAGFALAASVVALAPAAPASAWAEQATRTEDRWDLADGWVSLREWFNRLPLNLSGNESHIHLLQGQTYVLDVCPEDHEMGGALVGGDARDYHLHGEGSTIIQTCPDAPVINHTGTGKLWLHDVTLVGGTRAGGGGRAGAVTSVGPVEIENSAMTGPSTDDPTGAGAVYSDGEVILLRSVIDGASAPAGGGAIRAGGKITIERSAIVRTDSGDGAAVTAAGSIDVFNSTLAGNHNTGTGPSALETTGGGTVRITSATIAGNDGPQIGRNGGGASVQLRASAIVSPAGGPNCAFAPAATSLGHNYSTDASCHPNGTTDVSNGAPPTFRPLFLVGGVVPGLYPVPGSPLVDKIPSGSTPRPTDQRGITRPRGGASDIGAVEVLPCTTFSDVSASAPFCNEVGWLAGSGVTTGNPDGTFKPGATVTRGSMSAFLKRFERGAALVLPCVNPGAFPDVPRTHPFCNDVRWLVAEGITTGYPDGTFKPGAAVTRGSMAAFMYRLVGSPLGPNPPCPSAPFPDVPTSNPFCGHIAWLSTTGVTAGYPDGTFKPDEVVTRGSMAAFLYRLAAIAG